jgi:hypothetical protein
MSLGHVNFYEAPPIQDSCTFKPKNDSLDVLGIQTSHAIR